MSDYRYLAVDLLTNTVREEVPLSSVKVTHKRREAASFEASAPLRHPKITRQTLDPGRTMIVVERRGQVVGHGVLWGANPAEDRLRLSGAGLWSLFHRRHISETRTYTDVAEEAIALDLVAWAQGGGSLGYGPSVGDAQGDYGISTASVGSGQTRDRTYDGFQLKNIGQAVEQLSAVIGGFDFATEVGWSAGPGSTLERTFTVYNPGRGRRTGLVLELGTNIEQYSLQVNAGTQATRVFGVGAGEGEDMVRATAVDATSFGVYPLTEDVTTHKDVLRQATLAGHAEAVLQARRLRLTRPNLLNVRLGRQLSVGAWVVGDEVRLRLADGWTDVDAFYQVHGWTLSVDEDGKEVVSMDLIETGTT